MHSNVSETFSSVTIKNKTCIVDGYGIHINVKHNQLIVSDGVGRYRRERKFSRATANIESSFHQKYPKLFAGVMQVHDKRYESILSHPVIRRTGRPTRFVSFDELDELKIALADGYAEIWTNW